LLIQGSVQPPVAQVRAEFEAAMRGVAAKHFAVAWTDFSTRRGTAAGRGKFGR